jgi:predicted hydrocarbon binding protein
VCHAALGIILEALDWGSGGRRFKASQVTCHAAGDPSCDFVIYKEPIE